MGDKFEKQKGGGGLRLLRVGENVRHAVSTILARGDIQHDDLKGVSVTVSEVRVSPDLRNATIFFMPLGGGEREIVRKALDEVAPYIRGQLAKKVRMKYLPQLKFKLDESFDEATHIDDILRSEKVQRDLAHKDDSFGDEDA